VPDLDYSHERPLLTFVDLESSPPCAGVGGGVAHYQRLASTLVNIELPLAFIARSSFARDCLAPKFPSEQIISYDVRSPVDPSAVIRGAFGAATFAFYAPARFSNLLGARVLYNRTDSAPSGLPNELNII